MQISIWKSGLLVIALVALGCGGEAALGEECDEEGGEVDVCEEGSICGSPDGSENLECLKVCDDQADCPSGYDCNGVASSNVKGCRPPAQ